MKTIEDLVGSFESSPFLFVGAGLSRRYYKLPNWKDLLVHFAQIIRKDDFAYSYYENKATNSEGQNNKKMPLIAQLIQYDYDDLWFKDSSIRKLSLPQLKQVSDGISPFKMEVAAYIERQSKDAEEYKEEIALFSSISEKQISGVITTNYDRFIETHFNGYKTFIGQNELVFSVTQGIAEIYKIHGSVDKPDSIILTTKDYDSFYKKQPYLASKLLTIFMEYPIIFIGYSLNDPNIQSIIKSLLVCLDEKQIELLSSRFVFIDYVPNQIDYTINHFGITIEDRQLLVTRVTLSDFSILYRALKQRKCRLPVRILRKFKSQLYDLSLTNPATTTLKVAFMDDDRVSDDELVLGIGSFKNFGKKGLNGVTAAEWYKNIIFNDLLATPDDLLEYVYPRLSKSNSGMLPVYKYLHESKKTHPYIEKCIKKNTFNTLISNSIQKNRYKFEKFSSAKDLWEHEDKPIETKLLDLAHLTKEKISSDDLYEILLEIFNNNNQVLVKGSNQLKTNLRRLIRIYDYIKWKK